MFFPDSFKVSTPSDCEIQVTRDFDAPRRLVFDAFTKPELVRRWLLGPPGWTMPLCEIDLSVGGAYRYVWRSEKDGSHMAIGGVFREVIPLERLVATAETTQIPSALDPDVPLPTDAPFNENGIGSSTRCIAGHPRSKQEPHQPAWRD
jgi:uncharacterized protein YndB with AHSA1/START domain